MGEVIRDAILTKYGTSADMLDLITRTCAIFGDCRLRVGERGILPSPVNLRYLPLQHWPLTPVITSKVTPCPCLPSLVESHNALVYYLADRRTYRHADTHRGDYNTCSASTQVTKNPIPPCKPMRP